MSPLVLKQGRDCATGIAQKTIPMAGLRKILAPLPPLTEQKRIVEKVESLLGLCDSLQSQLVQGEAERSRLLAGVVRGIAH